MLSRWFKKYRTKEWSLFPSAKLYFELPSLSYQERAIKYCLRYALKERINNNFNTAGWLDLAAEISKLAIGQKTVKTWIHLWDGIL